MNVIPLKKVVQMDTYYQVDLEYPDELHELHNQLGP